MGIVTLCRDWDETKRRVFQRSLLLAPPFAAAGFGLGLLTGHQPVGFASLFAPAGILFGVTLNVGEHVAKQIRMADNYSVVDAAGTAGALSLAGVLLYHQRLATPLPKVARIAPQICVPAAVLACIAHYYSDWAVDRAEHKYLKAMLQQDKKVKYVVPYLQPRYLRYQQEGVPAYRMALTSGDFRNTMLYWLGKIPGVMVHPEAKHWKFGYRWVDDPEQPAEGERPQPPDMVMEEEDDFEDDED
eukprot:EG_transcript_20210